VTERANAAGRQRSGKGIFLGNAEFGDVAVAVDTGWPSIVALLVLISSQGTICIQEIS